MSSENLLSPMSGAPPRASRVQSVDRAMCLLKAVSGAPALESTAAMLAERTGLNRATAWRILSTLETHGMVTCDRGTGQWSIGMGVVEVARSAGLDAMIRSAHKVLEHLSLVTGETAALSVVGSSGLTYVDVVDPLGRPSEWVGRLVSLHATSTGKALLAFLEPDAARAMLGVMPRFTPSTITGPDRFVEGLERVRERGYAECHGELDPGSWGVSAPVLDGHRPMAVLSVWGPMERVSPARFEALGALTRESAESLSRR